MNENPNTNDPAELPPMPKAPWATMLTALMILFVFFGLVVVVLHYSENMGATPTPMSGANQLQELRASENETLNNYGYDEQTKNYRIPIDRAMEVLFNEANGNGGLLKSFPMPASKKK